MNRITTSLAICTFAFAAGFVSADDLVSISTGGYASALRTTGMMRKIDTDHDHTISRGEWVAYYNHLFDRLDKKKNGAVDQSEYLGANRVLASFATGGYTSALLTKEMFNKMDTDKDGTISRSEFVEYHLMLFGAMDTSSTHRGHLGAAEFFATGGKPAS